ncbi:MAG: hypothetical protein Q6363_008075 [Candidatus Njordarchaeota archaeon]
MDFEEYNANLLGEINKEVGRLRREIRQFVDVVRDAIDYVMNPQEKNIILVRLYSFVRFPSIPKVYDILRLLHAVNVPSEKIPDISLVSSVITLLLSGKHLA